MTTRRPGSYAHRGALAARLPLPWPLGRFAGRESMHAFRQLTAGRGGAQCAHCYGWRDDWRHL